jgi:hypothetical protein
MVCPVSMKAKLWVLWTCGVTQTALSADFRITSFDRGGTVAWANAFTAGVVTVETRSDVATGPWLLRQENLFTSNATGSAPVTFSPSNGFLRLLAVDISTNSPNHYTNLLYSYGTLETIAGRFITGGSVDKSNYWRAQYEGGPATNAVLSRPHIAFADPANNILIVDEGSSSVLKVTPAGTIHTYAGTHTNGFNGDGPSPATTLHLNWPNGGWMRADGTFYILDTYNGKVRRVDTNGLMTTLFTTAPMGDGRAFWVKSDESLIYFGSGSGTASTLNRWTPTGDVSVVRTGFGDLGNILGDERTGDLYITDRDANRVYRFDTNGVLTPIAGNGTTSNQTGGGEGGSALRTGLNKPRSIWFIPNGGYFLGEHDPGNRVWYVDPAGNIHRWLNGDSASTYGRGDGQWFYANSTSAKVSRVRSVVTDRRGNLIIVESNYGYVRRINFRRLTP